MTAARYANECIYCGEHDAPLTKEHVIARSLGGDVVLQKASCKTHGDITSAFETRMSRETYGVQRARDGVPTRDKERRKVLMAQRVSITGINAAGESETVAISRDEYPHMPMIVRLPTPGLLQGISPDIESGVALTSGLDTDQSSKISRRFGLRDIVWSSAGINPRTVIRVLAKTAHAFACYELGPKGFEPLLLPLIVDDVGSGSYFVGGFEPERRQNKDPLILREDEIFGEKYLIVDISLKFFPDMPLYQVVVGRPLAGSHPR
ncbi:HNH endonuclease [Pelomonas sp. KK5]|uniref:HNH endonuclease n=1 Tax=Pelomonas sp. KK5 TaxID=1855730 RepID=UPI00117C7201|nr:HNH endonuclease [Pelomonas sp. KK5]